VAAALRIADGNPVWLSLSIVPSKDTVVSPGTNPTLASVTVSSKDVFVYVKVENTGTVDLGPCPCTVPLPAAWTPPGYFSGFRASPPTTTTTQSQAGTTFTSGPYGDSISGSGFNHSLGYAAGERTWGWSPDGRLFGYASSSSLNGTDWYLTVVALQQLTRANGTTVAQGQQAASASGVSASAWNNSLFGWALSQAVVVSGPSPTGGIALTISCPFAPGGNAWGTLLPATAGQVDWVYLVSPCGSVVAVTPRILVQGNQRSIEVVSTTAAAPTQFTKNNQPTSVSITGSSPSITTVQHAANGVQIATGSGTVTVDDPDCMAVVGGGVLAWVDRVKASTLPSANLGVMSVGVSAASLIKKGQSLWVQVPNTNPSGWANQSEQHWCLLAQAYTADGTTIPKPWNGQATAPPPFPIGLDDCAQRNIMIA
jgi:hypothetical protein